MYMETSHSANEWWEALPRRISIPYMRRRFLNALAQTFFSSSNNDNNNVAV